MVLTKKKKITGIITAVFLLALVICSVGYYYIYIKSNFFPEKTTYVYVYPDMSFTNLVFGLKETGGLDDSATFVQLAKWKKYDRNMKVGRYAIQPGMNNSDVLKILLSGRQTPLQVKFNNIRTMPQFAGRIANQLMDDSISFLTTFQDEEFIRSLGFTEETLPAMFIPNTYELYWTTSPEKFCERMKAEFERFWNQERREKAEEIGLTPVEVSTLASIVEEETNKKDEFAIVAGLYINRLKKGMMLQADPTVKYAVGDFALRRVLNIHLEKESPYNTYRNYGLPPGPIRFPSIQVIDAVLNYAHHNYIYMCVPKMICRGGTTLLSRGHNMLQTGQNILLP